MNWLSQKCNLGGTQKGEDLEQLEVSRNARKHFFKKAEDFNAELEKMSPEEREKLEGVKD